MLYSLYNWFTVPLNFVIVFLKFSVRDHCAPRKKNCLEPCNIYVVEGYGKVASGKQTVALALTM